MKVRSKKTLKNDQTGLVSIIVTIIIILVISLIVIGFARISRREQRQAVDRQLSTQAYYAAETGVNDIVDVMRSGATVTENLTDCSSTISTHLSGQNDLDGSQVGYTCLFVDPDPASLEYSNIDTGTSKTVPIQSSSGSSINTLTISWQDKEGGTNLAGCQHPQLPDYSWWPNCDTGIMRVDLVPTAGSLNRDSLIDNTLTAFLYPASGSGSTSGSYSSYRGFGGQGSVVKVNCNNLNGSVDPNHKQCRFTITGLSSTSYMMRIKSIYRPATATITAESGGSAVEFADAQAIVDSTGKAQDVLRRIQVRIPISPFNSPFPEFAVQTVDTLCKRFQVAPPNIYIPDTTSGCNIL